VLELHYNKASAVTYADTEQGVVPTTAVVTLRSADDAELAAPVVSLPTVDTTVQGNHHADHFNVDDATGITVGDPYRLEFYGQRFIVFVAKVDSSTVYLRESLPEAPPNGAAFKGLTMSATIPAQGTPRANAMLRWEFDDGSTYRQAQQVVDLVRWPFGALVTAADVVERLASMGVDRSDVWCERAAEAANMRVRTYLRSGGRRPDLIADAGDFAIAAGYAVDLVLAERGVLVASEDPMDTRERLRDGFEAEMSIVLRGVTYYDGNDDGKLDEEQLPALGTSRIVR
jgi:hypothetical protein